MSMQLHDAAERDEPFALIHDLEEVR
jgi:hypothetical protein